MCLSSDLLCLNEMELLLLQLLFHLAALFSRCRNHSLILNQYMLCIYTFLPKGAVCMYAKTEVSHNAFRIIQILMVCQLQRISLFCIFWWISIESFSFICGIILTADDVCLSAFSIGLAVVFLYIFVTWAEGEGGASESPACSTDQHCLNKLAAHIGSDIDIFLNLFHHFKTSMLL